MKKIKILALAFGALALGACSSDDVLITENSNGVLPGGDGYVSFKINLPTTPSSRAANDVFEDGLYSEYVVNDVTLLLFNGDSESDATFFAAYELANTFSNSDTNEATEKQVTQSASFTQKITMPESGKIYALVVLNKDGMLSVNGSGTSATGTFGANTLDSSLKFSDLQTTPVNADISSLANTKRYSFYMTNAPLANSRGGQYNPNSNGSVSINTLVEISTDCIYASATEAENHPAATINVERGVAKVTVSTVSEVTDGTFTLGDDNTVVTLKGFILDLTNSVTYPVRNSQTSDVWWSYRSSDLSVANPYRFIGGTSVTTDLYRTYWATDPNYEDETEYPLINEPDDLSDETFSEIDGSDAQYCLENTFDITNQLKAATTRVIIKAQVGDGNSSFYTVDDTETMLNYEEVYYKVIKKLASISDVFDAYDVLGEDLYSNIEIGGLTPEVSYDSVKINIGLGEDFDTKFAAYLSNEAVQTFKSEVENGTINTTINSMIKISYYKDGICYYAVPIKHFGDDLTPWSSDDVSSSRTAYPDNDGTAAENWLGRYGVLRNNWYDLEISSITGIGSPTRPPVPDEWDDPINSWVSVTVNVLSWAYRKQGVDL